MVNTTHINVLEIIGHDTSLKRVASTNGGEYQGPCPFCGGKDRFCVWPEEGRYWCRQCKCSGDAISYLKYRDNISFKEAAAILQIPVAYRSERKKPSVLAANTISKPGNLNYDAPALADPAWQKVAQDFIHQSEAMLWSKEGQVGQTYLMERRGLSQEVIKTARLGFNLQTHYEQWGQTQVYLSCGIVIPWIIQDDIWSVNIRRPKGEVPKYLQAKGGANGLYGVDQIKSGCIVIMVEGEFDALLIQQHVATLISPIIPVATGSTNKARLLRWVTLLSLAQTILLAFDVDENGAGDKAAEWWQHWLGTKAKRLRPTQHDVTDMVQAGEDLTAWITSAL